MPPKAARIAPPEGFKQCSAHKNSCFISIHGKHNKCEKARENQAKSKAKLKGNNNLADLTAAASPKLHKRNHSQADSTTAHASCSSNADKLSFATFPAFLLAIEQLAQDKEHIAVKARINLEGAKGTAYQKDDVAKEIHGIKDAICKAIGWNFITKDLHESGDDEKGHSLRICYECCQSESARQKQRKHEEEAKHRNTEGMDRFHCHGSLHIAIHHRSRTAEVYLHHAERHPGRSYKFAEMRVTSGL